MKYIEKIKKGALWACFFIIIFQVNRFLSAEKDLDTVLNFIADFGYNMGMIFVVGPLAVTLLDKALINDDEVD